MHEAHGLSQPLLTLLRITVGCSERKTIINFCLPNDDSRQIADSTHTKQFLRAVFTRLEFPVEIDVRFVFCIFCLFACFCFLSVFCSIYYNV